MKCERTLCSEDSPFAERLVLTCQLHSMHTSLGNAYAPLKSDISGVISIALALRPAGVASQLRKKMVRFITEKVTWIPGKAPDTALSRENDAYNNALICAVYDIHSLDGTKSAMRLMVLLSGSDLRNRETLHIFLGGRTVKDLATELVQLVSKSVPKTLSTVEGGVSAENRFRQ